MTDYHAIAKDYVAATKDPAMDINTPHLRSVIADKHQFLKSMRSKDSRGFFMLIGLLYRQDPARMEARMLSSDSVADS